MEPRFQQRKEQLLAECQVSPTAFRGAVHRIEVFAQPFIAALPSSESQQHTRTYLSGLLSDIEHKNAEAIAYRHDLDRQTLQHYIGTSPWDHQPPIDELNRQVAAALGRPSAVLVFDASAFPKKGDASVGVQRQWCGRLGKVENCQVGVYLGYVSDVEQVLVDFRLYLPAEWAKDRKRRKRCGVPKEVRYRTAGSVATTRWAVPRGSARSWPDGTSVTCWPYRRTRASATWRPNHRRTGGTAVTPRRRSRACVPGARRCPMRRGVGWRCAMVRRAPWVSRSWRGVWSRRSNAGWWASRSCWWWCGPRKGAS